MANNNKNNDGGNPLLTLLLILLFVTIIFVFCPGMMVMSIIQSSFHTTLDIGQMWTFSIIISVALFGTLYFSTKENAIKLYLSLCLLIVVSGAIAHFGIKASLPSRFISYFFK